jgi:predicted Zn-dependent peptidase
MHERMRELAKAKFFIGYWSVISLFAGYVPLNGQSTEDRTSFRKLDNGLAVVLIRKDDAPNITAICGFKAGGVDDPPGFSGAAHLVEHLMKRAMSDALPTGAFYRELSREYSKGSGMDPQKIKDLETKIESFEEQIKGMELIAATTYDFVYYQGTFSSGQLELFCRMGSELLKEKHLEGVVMERETLLAERKSTLDLSTGEQIQVLTFGARPYGRSVAGNPDDIRAITPAAASDFKKKHYIPNNCVLVFVGDLNPEALFPLIESNFGNIPRGEEPSPAITSDPPARYERRLVLERDTKPEVLINFIKPAFPHKDDLAARVLGAVLAHGDGARLNTDLIKTRRIADTVTVSYGGGSPGERFENAFWISAVPSAGHPPEKVETALLEHLERLREEPVNDDELEKAKGEITNELDIETQPALQMAMTALRYQLIHGDWKLGLMTREFCKGVSADDIREFARKYFRLENRTTIVFTKKGLE